MFFRKRRCAHANIIWIRQKKKLIRKCVKCGHKIKYGEKVSCSE